MSKKTTAYRSAKTGHFVTKKFADKNPDTTVKETIKKGKPSAKKGK
jgi:hypothetical protein